MASAEENRRLFPTVAGWLDGLREAFGPGVRVTFASEAGREIGKRDTDGFVAEGWPYPIYACAKAPRLPMGKWK